MAHGDRGTALQLKEQKRREDARRQMFSGVDLIEEVRTVARCSAATRCDTHFLQALARMAVASPSHAHRRSLHRKPCTRTPRTCRCSARLYSGASTQWRSACPSKVTCDSSTCVREHRQGCVLMYHSLRGQLRTFLLLSTPCACLLTEQARYGSAVAAYFAFFRWIILNFIGVAVLSVFALLRHINKVRRRCCSRRWPDVMYAPLVPPPLTPTPARVCAHQQAGSGWSDTVNQWVPEALLPSSYGSK